MFRVYLSLGANLGKPIKQLSSAINALQNTSGIFNLKKASFYKTAPIGPKQPDFINTAVELSTTLTPFELLQRTQAIEKEHHRERLEHWGPRTLDIDLILYEDQKINHPLLTIPHPRMQERGFVLVPLYELNPHLISPTYGPIKTLLDEINHLDDIQRLPKGEYNL